MSAPSPQFLLALPTFQLCLDRVYHTKGQRIHDQVGFGFWKAFARFCTACLQQPDPKLGPQQPTQQLLEGRTTLDRPQQEVHTSFSETCRLIITSNHPSLPLKPSGNPRHLIQAAQANPEHQTNPKLQWEDLKCRFQMVPGAIRNFNGYLLASYLALLDP